MCGGGSGSGSTSSSSARRLPLRTVASRFCHHATFRGHGLPVFSVLFDPRGSRIVTGADDANIKVSRRKDGVGGRSQLKLEEHFAEAFSSLQAAAGL